MLYWSREIDRAIGNIVFVSNNFDMKANQGPKAVSLEYLACLLCESEDRKMKSGNFRNLFVGGLEV